MIPLLIFYLHITGLAAAFTAEYQKEGLSHGVLTVGFMLLIFSVGWSVITFFLKYLMSQEGVNIWLNRDAISLILLSIAEAFFYFFYFRGDKKNSAAF